MLGYALWWGATAIVAPHPAKWLPYSNTWCIKCLYIPEMIDIYVDMPYTKTHDKSFSMSLTGIEVGDHYNKWAITLQSIYFTGPKKNRCTNCGVKSPGTKVEFPWVPHNSHVGWDDYPITSLHLDSGRLGPDGATAHDHPHWIWYPMAMPNYQPSGLRISDTRGTPVLWILLVSLNHWISR